MNYGAMEKQLSAKDLGKLIRRIRCDLGLSQRDFAAKLGTPGGQGEVSKWEAGKERPGPDKLATIAKLAGVGLEAFQPTDTSRVDLLIGKAATEAGGGTRRP